MRVLVCGGRNYQDRHRVCVSLDSFLFIFKDELVVIQGGATGADLFAKNWCSNHQVPTFHFPARWEKYGKSAGICRNIEMLEVGKPDVVVAFPTPGAENKDTRHMMAIAAKAELPVVNGTELFISILNVEMFKEELEAKGKRT